MASRSASCVTSHLLWLVPGADSVIDQLTSTTSSSVAGKFSPSADQPVQEACSMSWICSEVRSTLPPSLASKSGLLVEPSPSGSRPWLMSFELTSPLSPFPPQAMASAVAPSAAKRPGTARVLRFRIFFAILDPNFGVGDDSRFDWSAWRWSFTPPTRWWSRGPRHDGFGPAYKYGTDARPGPGTGRRMPRLPSAFVHRGAIFPPDLRRTRAATQPKIWDSQPPTISIVPPPNMLQDCGQTKICSGSLALSKYQPPLLPQFPPVGTL